MKNLKDTITTIHPESLQLPKELLSPNQFDHYLQMIRLKRKPAIRVNTLKIEKRSVMNQLRTLGISVTEFHKLPNCFLVNNSDSKNLLKTELAREGKIYLQGISSQIPAFLLAPSPGDFLLDLAAAPGSKTTQLCALMENKGCIDAVEPDFIRKERLEYNVRIQGCKIVAIHHIKGELFLSETYGSYDKVLIDAPCSGEGRFNIYDKSSYAAYRLQNIPKFHKLQVKLLRKALAAVRKGGVVLYSTCTLNTIENEEVLEEALADTNTEIMELPEFLRTLPEALSPRSQTSNYPRLRKDMKNCIRILPSQRMEGFFLAKIIKR